MPNMPVVPPGPLTAGRHQAALARLGADEISCAMRRSALWTRGGGRTEARGATSGLVPGRSAKDHLSDR
jgi:hypothetical protein